MIRKIVMLGLMVTQCNVGYAGGVFSSLPSLPDDRFEETPVVKELDLSFLDLQNMQQACFESILQNCGRDVKWVRVGNLQDPKARLSDYQLITIARFVKNEVNLKLCCSNDVTDRALITFVGSMTAELSQQPTLELAQRQKRSSKIFIYFSGRNFSEELAKTLSDLVYGRKVTLLVSGIACGGHHSFSYSPYDGVRWDF